MKKQANSQKQKLPVSTNEKQAIRTIYFSIFGSLGLAVVKGITGYFGNSYALIADAIESTTDVFSTALVLFAFIYASKPADSDHPYGHGRAEALMTFLVVGFLVVSATVIVFQSIGHIRTPHSAPEPYTLAVLGAVIFIKEFFFRFINRRSRETGSTVLKADAWHHRSDAITSLAAFAGIAVALVFGEGYETADDWAALVAAGFIYYNSYLIFRPALGEIMDEHLHDELIGEIRQIAKKVEGVVDTEKCFIRKTGMTYWVDLHLTVNGDLTVREGHEIAHNVKDRIRSEFPEIVEVLMHVEPDD